MSNFCGIEADDPDCVKELKIKVQKSIDVKYWNSTKAVHWVATFLDPTFKSMGFISTSTPSEKEFKDNLVKDVMTWTQSYITNRR